SGRSRHHPGVGSGGHGQSDRPTVQVVSVNPEGLFFGLFVSVLVLVIVGVVFTLVLVPATVLVLFRILVILFLDFLLVAFRREGRCAVLLQDHHIGRLRRARTDRTRVRPARCQSQIRACQEVKMLAV